MSLDQKTENTIRFYKDVFTEAYRLRSQRHWSETEIDLNLAIYIAGKCEDDKLMPLLQQNGSLMVRRACEAFDKNIPFDLAIRRLDASMREELNEWLENQP